MKHNACLLITCLLLLWTCCVAAPSLYPLPPKQKQQFQWITHHYRCLVCANESLAESPSNFANDLKTMIAHFVKQGRSNAWIDHYLKSKFGNQISLTPPKKKNTLILWNFPSIILLISLFFLWRKQKTT
jgi:cytochrome c-type biogenesis protein CcmH